MRFLGAPSNAGTLQEGVPVLRNGPAWEESKHEKGEAPHRAEDYH